MTMGNRKLIRPDVRKEASRSVQFCFLLFQKALARTHDFARRAITTVFHLPLHEALEMVALGGQPNG